MPTRLDPRYAMDAYASRVGSLVFASLLSPGRNGDYEPYLARTWDRVDPLTWRFHLGAGFLFHDGTPVRADDVVATYEALKDPSLASPRRALLSRISSMEAPSPQEVVFHLREPDAAFLEAATIAVLPARLARATALEPLALVGAGPYRIADFETDQVIRLTAFQRFALGPPTLAEIEFRIIPDALMRALELRHASIDFVANALDPDTVRWITAKVPQLRVERGPSDSFQYLGMNVTHPPLDDVRVRRAIAHAIDREQIVQHVLEGQARVADGLLPPHHWAYTGRVRHYRFDPAEAMRLLDRAGLRDPDGSGPRPRVTLSYKTTTNELARRTAEAIAEQLRSVGINLEILTYEWGTFFADIRRGSFHLYSLQWVGVHDPDIYRQTLHSAMVPPEGNNRGRYRNPRMDRLTDEGLTAASTPVRRRIYARVQRLAARDLPFIPLWWPEQVVVSTRRLEGFMPHPSGDLYALYQSRLARPAPEHAQ
jgi:peptide/nickel transport system substrate-binding protein